MSMRSRRALRWLGALAVLATIGMAASEATASSKTDKIRRQIRVLEAMVDQMLVESPNWLVQGRDEARGSYVEGHGVVITFDVSLVGGSHWHGHDDDWWDWIWDKDDRVIVLKDEKGDEDDESKSWRERRMQSMERRYTRGKVEITDTILDYADVLTFAKDDEWLEIEARLRRSEYFRDKDIDRLTMKVKMSDVRSFAAEKMNEKDFVQKIQVEES